MISDQKLKNLLIKEVAAKGASSNLSFALFAFFTIFYGFGLEKFILHVRIAALAVIFIAIIRYKLNREILKLEVISNAQWVKLKWLIWGNAFCWSFILNLASFELKLQGPHFIVVTTLIAGMVGASIVSLSFFKSLFLPFQLLLLIPQVLIILYFYFSSEHLNFIPLIFLYLMYFIYQIRLFGSQNKGMVQLLRYQISLEQKNLKLKESREELLAQTMQLVHASRLGALGEMSASLAHEINNPLSIIGTCTKMIQKEMDKSPSFSDSQVPTYLDRINKSVVRVGKIIRGLRTFSNQSDLLPKEKTLLKEVVEDTCFFCSELLVSKDILLEIEAVPEVKVLCHPVQISQVLINLIKNASDVLVDESDVSQRWIRLHFEIIEDSIYIYVQNGSKKIDKQIADKIFDPFFTTKASGVGTGLGLSISKKIMSEHHGDISIDLSFPFTTFLLQLPIVKLEN